MLRKAIEQLQSTLNVCLTLRYFAVKYKLRLLILRFTFHGMVQRTLCYCNIACVRSPKMNWFIYISLGVVL